MCGSIPKLNTLQIISFLEVGGAEEHHVKKNQYSVPENVVAVEKFDSLFT